MTRSNSLAFTLIELLVVVSIIALLLALLAPAMDQAIYQAELAVCGADYRAVGTAVATYAAENKRYYPRREGIQLLSSTRPSLLYGGNLRIPQFDDRPLLRTFLNLNEHLQCPLSKSVDLETRDPASWVYGDRNLWFGWRFRTGSKPFKGMMKLGDGFEWAGDTFRVLASDLVVINNEKNGAHGEHPDHEGLMVSVALQDSTAGADVEVGGKNTFGIWAGPRQRGTIDKNVLFDDLSVTRYDRVAWDAHMPGKAEGWARVPEKDNDNQNWDGQLPLR
jgi:prepilin-type N-terminal cleavage/methylation domain-containing protein